MAAESSLSFLRISWRRWGVMLLVAAAGQAVTAWICVFAQYDRMQEDLATTDRTATSDGAPNEPASKLALLARAVDGRSGPGAMDRAVQVNDARSLTGIGVRLTALNGFIGEGPDPFVMDSLVIEAGWPMPSLVGAQVSWGSGFMRDNHAEIGWLQLVRPT